MGQCNCCMNEQLKRKLKDRYLLLTDLPHGWPTVYELGAEPIKGQDEPMEHNGRPIRFCASFMSLAEHSYDEDCNARRPLPEATTPNRIHYGNKKRRGEP